MPRKKYRIVGLPESLYLKCQRLVESSALGYTSVSELVKDGTRRRLEEIEKQLEKAATNREQETP